MPESLKRLLIIDDQPELCEFLNTHLKDSGFALKQAYDGDRGFQLAIQDAPDCILLDVRMPREDGLTFLRKLRSYRDDDSDRQKKIRGIPVIVLTAAGEAMRSVFQTEGVCQYVSKPFDILNLKAIILSVVQDR